MFNFTEDSTDAGWYFSFSRLRILTNIFMWRKTLQNRLRSRS